MMISLQIMSSSPQTCDTKPSEIENKQNQRRKRDRDYYAQHKEEISIRRHMQREQKKKLCGTDIGTPQMDTDFVVVSKKFRTRIDALVNIGTCKVCNECYPGMHTSSTDCVLVCTRCVYEKRATSICNI